MSTENEPKVDEKKEADVVASPADEKKEADIDPPPAKKVKTSDDSEGDTSPKKVEAIDSEHVSVEEENNEIKVTAKSKIHAVVLGKDVLLDDSNKSTSWKITVDKIGDFDWILAGIIANQKPDGKSYQDPTSFGWAGSFEVYAEGANMSMKAANRGGWIKWQEGDEAVFQLTAESIKMFHKRCDKTFTIPIPEAMSKKEWRLHLSFFSPGDAIRISVPTKEELGKVE